MPSVFIKTYGCQMNERDSEAVAAQLQEKGYEVTRSETEADIVLLNTCSVRDMAEQKAIGKMTHLMGAAKAKGREQVFGVMGCMAQSRGADLVDTLPDLDLVLGTQKFHRAGEWLDALLAGRESRIVDVDAEAGSEGAIKEHLLSGKTGAKSVTAFVSIMQGCNQFCSFCIVPHTRGRERCRSIESIVDECRELASRGVREVTLLGQIVNSYGKRDIPVQDGKSGFVQLLEAVSEVDGIDRIRFTSPHPKGYGLDLVNAYRALPKLCENAHIPVQSGSDRLLKLMKRQYTRARFLELVGQLREACPEIGLSTDIIVGFPGETEADFEETLSLCEEVRFDQAFIFRYSKRKDTPAAEMADQLSEDVKMERNQRLLDLINRIANEKYEKFIGQRVEILVTGPSRRNAERLEGRTRCNKIVVFEGDPRLVGQRIETVVESVGSFTLYGNAAIVNLEGQEHYGAC